MIEFIAGIDEAGRGPLAGPVVAAAVILDPNQSIAGLADSKLLSEKKREALFDEIIIKALAYGIGWASPAEIADVNILQATFLAMKRALLDLNIHPTEVWIDGNRLPVIPQYSLKAIVDGDATIPQISAASIIAKVCRDRIMTKYDRWYPHYGFREHKGYGTKKHYDSLMKWGACPIHRRSFNLDRQQTLFE